MTTDSEPIWIRCAEDLFSVLSTGSLGARLAVLQGIASDPERALRLGPHQGEDLVDLLIRLMPCTSGALRQMQLVCLMSFQDQRTTDFMVTEFSRSRHAASIVHLGKRLSLEKGVDFFRPFLWKNQPAQALAAARFCSQAPDLEPADRLRVALILNQNPPPISSGTLDVWLAELHGPYQLQARTLAAGRGKESLILWFGWKSLEAQTRQWLLGLTERFDPSLAIQKLSELVEEPDVSRSVAWAALESGLPLPSALLSHGDPEVRAAAVAGGRADADLDRFLAPDRSRLEALAATRRCGTRKLLELLRDHRWEIRAAATARLSQLADRPLEEVRVRAASDHLGERVAAVEVLRRWGDHEWLEDCAGHQWSKMPS